jgi:hypothetical protein
MRHRSASSLEALESRIAPASITVGTVTVTTSKGTSGDLTNAAVFDTGGDGHLISLTLGAKFKGSDVSVTTSAGPGLANVGLIEAAGIDLHNVVIDGDLGQLNAGDAVPSTPALTKLEVKSLGTTLTTQAPGGDVDSLIEGRIGTLLVHGNIAGSLTLDGPGGSLGTATIEGSLAGGAGANSGSIIVSQTIGSILVSGSLTGGDGGTSGSIMAQGSIAHAEISGNLTGGKGSGSGSLWTNGELTVGIIDSGVTGGTDATGGPNSGRIFAGAKIGQLTITGALTGGKTLASGGVSAGIGGIDFVRVNGGLAGGDAKDSGTIATSGVLRSVVVGLAEEGMTGGAGEHSGSLLSSVRIANATINGDITGGDGLTSGVIASAGTIGTVTVNGDLVGGNLNDLSGVIGSAKAMGSVTVTGNVKGGDANSSGQIVSVTTIGSIHVEHDVIGGKGSQSGSLGALGSLGTITVDGKLAGGIGPESGSVLTGASATKITIDSITGGDGDQSGGVGVQGTLTKLIVTHDVTGGLGNYSANIFGGYAKSIFIGGSLIANAGNAAGSVPAPIGTASVAYFGPILSVEVVGDLVGQGSSSGAIYSNGLISKAVVHGSLVGGAGALSGSIFTERGELTAFGLGKVTVDVNLTGGGGQLSGSIRSVANIGSVTIGTFTTPAPGPVQLDLLVVGTGNITGGGDFSAQVLATGSIGTVKVAGSVTGVGDESAQISAGGNLTSVLVNGSVSGGRANYDLDNRVGQINALKTIGSVTIQGSVVGGGGNYSSTIVGGSIGSVSIDNDLTGGIGAGAGSIFALTGSINTVNIGGNLATKAPASVSPSRTAGASGSIAATTTIGSVTVEGDVIGLAGTPVIISAGGRPNPTSDAQALAIKSVRVLGPMSYTQVLAGYAVDGSAINGDVQIGTIDVGSNGDFPTGYWHDNDIIAGFTTGQPAFGSGNDTLISGASQTKILSKIAKIVVRGDMGGSASRHGLDAELVASIIVNGVAENLNAGARNDFFAIAGDFSGNTFVDESPVNP